MTIPEPIPAIGYIRVSMLMEEQISPEIQRHAIDDWARRRGRRIVSWIEDLDVSGRTFRRRIMDAIEAVEAGQAREIVVWKYSRFGRNRTGQAVNLGRINMVGGELQSATEEVDASTAVGKLTRGMLMELAAFESDRVGEQWAEAWANRIARGLPSHGKPQFGYVLRGRQPDPLQPGRTVRDPTDGEERYEINGVKASVLAEMYRRYTFAGHGFLTLVGWLNTLGIRDEPWEKNTVIRLLDSGFGAGLIRVHDPNCSCPRPGRCPNRTYVPGAQSAIITLEQWRAYLRCRAQRSAIPPRSLATVYPLSARIHCGHCKYPMVLTNVKGVRARRYRCSGYVRHQTCSARSVDRLRVEALVLRELGRWADDIDARPRIVEPPIKPRPDRKPLEQEVDRHNAALDRLTMQLAKGLVPEDTYTRTRDRLLEERQRTSDVLAKLAVPATMERHEYVPVIRSLIAEWDTLDSPGKQALLAEMLDVVEVYRTDRQCAWVIIRSAWGEEVRADL